MTSHSFHQMFRATAYIRGHTVLLGLLPMVATGSAYSAVAQDQAAETQREASPPEALLESRLDDAVSDYNTAIDAIVEKVSEEMQVRLDAALDRGDLDTGTKMQEAMDSLRAEGLLPKDSDFSKVVANADRSLTRAFSRLLAEYDAVVREYTRRRLVDRAVIVRGERNALQRLVPPKGPTVVKQSRKTLQRAANQTPILDEALSKGLGAKEARMTLRHQQEEPGMCSVTCASIILDHFGTKIPPRALKVMSRGRNYNPHEPFNDFTGTLFQDVCGAVSRVGFTWTQQHFANDQNGFQAGLQKIRQSIDAGNPVLIDLTNAFGQVGSHVFVVCGYSDRTGTLYLLDSHAPEPGTRELAFEALASVWNSLGIKGQPFNGRGLVLTSPKQPVHADAKSTEFSP